MRRYIEIIIGCALVGISMLVKFAFRTSDNLDVPEFYCGKSTGNHRCCPYSYFYFGFANASKRSTQFYLSEKEVIGYFRED